MNASGKNQVLRTREAIIGLGSNLGDRRAFLARAIEQLQRAPGIEEVHPSPIYETAPVGPQDQPDFLNMAAKVVTALSPEDLLALLLRIETTLGRVRTVRWGPRTIDLDLLFYENETRDSASLTLPHPRWAERTFVTIPLKDLVEKKLLESEIWKDLRKQLRHLVGDDPVARRWNDIH